MRSNRFFCTRAVAALATAAALAVFGGVSATAQETGKLTIASFYPVDKVAGWEGMLKSFREKHGDVEIEVQVTPFAQYLPKLLSQIAGGDAPDVVAVENTPFPQFVRRNILEDLTPLMEATDGFTRDDFFEHLLDRYTVDGKVHGIPYDAQPFAILYYNPSMFEQAGVEEPTGDWSWDQLRSAALALTDQDTQTYGLCLSANTRSNWRYFLFSGGGSYVDDGRMPTRSTVADAASVDATKFYIALMNEDKSVPTVRTLEAMGGASQNCTNLFLNGKSAMMIGGFWKAVENPEAFKKMGVKIAMAPVKDPQDRVYPTGGTAYSILRTSDNKELAWSFLQEFLGEAGFKAAYGEADLGAIYPPAHRPAFNWYSSQPIEFLDGLQPNSDALAFIRFAPFRTDWTEIRTRCVDPDLDAMLNGTANADETLKAMASCIDGSL